MFRNKSLQLKFSISERETFFFPPGKTWSRQYVIRGQSTGQHLRLNDKYCYISVSADDDEADKDISYSCTYVAMRMEQNYI